MIKHGRLTSQSGRMTALLQSATYAICLWRSLPSCTRYAYRQGKCTNPSRLLTPVLLIHACVTDWHQRNIACICRVFLNADSTIPIKQQTSLQKKCIELYRMICVMHCNTLTLGYLPTLLVPRQVNIYCILTHQLSAAVIISAKYMQSVVMHVPSCSIPKNLGCKATYWPLDGVYMHHTQSMNARACRRTHRSWQLAWWRSLCSVIKATCIDGQQRFLAWWVHSQT